MHLERAEGGRQDLDYDAAVSMYINRKYMVEYLHEKVYSSGHKNILEDFIYVTHCKEEYIAMMRANTIIDLRIARPMRFLAGKCAELDNWSPFSMGPVLDEIEQLFERAARDGSVLLKPDLQIFRSVQDSQPKFREYLDHLFNKEKVLSPDGTTEHLQYKLALEEALTPSDESNERTRALTIEYLQIQCEAGLRKLHDKKTVLPEYAAPRPSAPAAHSPLRTPRPLPPLPAPPSRSCSPDCCSPPQRALSPALSAQVRRFQFFSSAAPPPSLGRRGRPRPAHSPLRTPAHPVASPSPPSPSQQNPLHRLLLPAPESPPTRAQRPVATFPIFVMFLPTSVPRPPGQVPVVAERVPARGARRRHAADGGAQRPGAARHRPLRVVRRPDQGRHPPALSAPEARRVGKAAQAAQGGRS